SLIIAILAASIQGVVVKEGNGEALSKALVELRSAEKSPDAPTTAITSGDGKFIFRNVQPGQYKLIVTRAGYVQLEYKPIISIAAGQQVVDLRLPLMQTGTIYGRITDRTGQPLTNATVRAMKVSYSDGQRRLKTVQTAITNDLGEYRLFWLPPGSYFVSVLAYSSAIEHALGGMLITGADPKNDPSVGI